MDNKELLQQLQDAIEQETAIAQQEQMIAEYNALSLQRKPIQQEIQIPPPYGHTFATLIQPHTDIKTLQTIMGHSDIETTLDRYTHFVHENVEKLAQINPYCDTPVTTNAPQSQ